MGTLFGDLANSMPSGGGNFFKPQLGDNRVRVVGAPVKVFRPEYVAGGKPRYCLTDEGAVKYGCTKQVKFAMWIIDRSDATIKCAEFGASILGGIADLAETEGYKFEGLPPYDFIIKQKKEGDKTSYNVLAYPTPSDLTSDEIKALAEKGDLRLFLREKADDKEMCPAF